VTDSKTTNWTLEHDDEWARTLNGLQLRVTPDPDDPDNPDEPWTWEVLAVHDDWDEEIGLGGAISREAAMAAAELAASPVRGEA
jgi:hypothetical protein